MTQAALQANGRRVLITGALGCLGAWAVRELLDRGDVPIAFDLSDDRHRLELLLNEDELAGLSVVRGDLTDRKAVGIAMDDYGVDGVLHFAALQVPFCAANPMLGALVNVVGTVNLFEAVKARRDRIAKVVYASSAAVYDLSDSDPGGVPVAEDHRGQPRTHYGVYKQANEGTARVYWDADRIPSVGLRPYAVFGIGRDQGLTSSPTKAMLAAALRQDYAIGFGSRCQLHYAKDVAAAFLAALDSALDGAPVFNLGGEATEMIQVVSHIESLVPEMRGRIAILPQVLPFPESYSSTIFDHLPAAPQTPLRDAIAETIEAFSRLATTGGVTSDGLR